MWLKRLTVWHLLLGNCRGQKHTSVEEANVSQRGWINQAQNLLTCELSSTINDFNSSSKLTSERRPPVQCHSTLYFSLCSSLPSVSANFSLFYSPFSQLASGDTRPAHWSNTASAAPPFLLEHSLGPASFWPPVMAWATLRMVLILPTQLTALKVCKYLEVLVFAREENGGLGELF